MDEIDLLKRVGAGSKEDEFAERRARAALSASIEREMPSRVLKTPPRRPRWRITALAVAAAVAAAVLAVPVMLGHGPGGAPFASAADALKATADVAASQPQHAPAAGQYLYTKTEGLGATFQLSPPADGSSQSSFTSSSEPTTEEFWLGPDGSGERRGTSGGKPYVDTYAPGELSFDDYSNLPTHPAELLAKIRSGDLGGGNSPSDAVCFQIVGETLVQGYAPPELRSALYQVAAMIPGVQLDGNVTDHTGRPGIEVSYTHGGSRDGLIFDPTTSQILESNLVFVAQNPQMTSIEGAIPGPGPGEQTVAYTVYDEWGIVNAIGDRP
jgi:hypothetical protein